MECSSWFHIETAGDQKKLQDELELLRASSSSAWTICASASEMARSRGAKASPREGIEK